MEIADQIIEAVERSRKFDTIVFVDIPEADVDGCVSLLADQSDNHDFVRNGDVMEVWGWDDEQPEGAMDWRVHLRIS